ncbi:MAG: hypothetical protein M3Q79_02815 [bacterium]|nr:hypothetical protein [bacterium]
MRHPLQWTAEVKMPNQLVEIDISELIAVSHLCPPVDDMEEKLIERGFNLFNDRILNITGNNPQFFEMQDNQVILPAPIRYSASWLIKIANSFGGKDGKPELEFRADDDYVETGWLHGMHTTDSLLHPRLLELLEKSSPEAMDVIGENIWDGLWLGLKLKPPVSTIINKIAPMEYIQIPGAKLYEY